MVRISNTGVPPDRPQRLPSNPLGSSTGEGELPVLALFAGAMVLGGASNPTSWGGITLQLLSLAVLLVTVMRRPRSVGEVGLPLAWAWLGSGVLALILMQLLPLPASLWSTLPGRAIAVESLKLADLPLPIMPLSLVPASTIAAALAGLPVAVLAILLTRTSAFPTSKIAKMLVGFALLSWAVGVLQVVGGQDSVLYFHAKTARGLAVGFFANPNHLATLLVMAVPLVAALVVTEGEKRGLARKSMFAIVIAYGALAALGVPLTASVAGIILLGVAVLASLVIIPASGGARSGAMALAVLLAAVAVAFSIGVLGTSFEDAQGSRPDIWRTTLRGIGQFWPAGSGLGTFTAVYRTFEDPDALGTKFINHAHNDYLEVLFEAGLAGAVLMVAVVGWWAARSVQVWRGGTEPSIWHRAASIVVGVGLLHSLVDYPLRTPAVLMIACFFAAVLAAPRRS
ncbi:O-antigen ligase [Parafrankia sp. BMG5.11]|uniref:O-antigen ligase family protein n=1 Tax=Parafrankia sp. BMG5.11 TaxID=222540 RepID=UPI00103EC8A9|nr:O-antigen ligase family protein [Parafrankia sp. BMG5.11]TCJ39563.1 O-antigen ligase family protein [Parafrankia sp. BMG5.11]